MLPALALLVHGAAGRLYDHGRPDDGQPAAGAQCHRLKDVRRKKKDGLFRISRWHVHAFIHVSRLVEARFSLPETT